MGLLDTEILKTPFVAVGDAAEQALLLEDAVRNAIPVTLWTKKKEHLIQHAVLTSTNGPMGFEVKVLSSQSNKRAVEYLLANKQPCYLNFGTFKCGVFFSGVLSRELIAGRYFRLIFDPPRDFFKVQRRIAVRLPIRAPYLLVLELKIPAINQFVQRKVIDVSIGGLAILTSANEAEYFSKGRVIPEVKFVVRSRTITASAEVRHSRLINEEKLPQLFVGLRFMDLDKKDQGMIEKFINEEMQTQFSTFLRK